MAACERRELSNSMENGMANKSLACMMLLLNCANCANCGTIIRAVWLAPKMLPSLFSAISPSVSSPSGWPGQLMRSSKLCGCCSSSAFSIVRAVNEVRCFSSGRSGTMMPVKSSMPMHCPFEPNKGEPAQLKAVLSLKKCSPRCIQTGCCSVKAAPIAVVPTACSDKSTPIRLISRARLSVWSIGPFVSITMP